MENFVFNAHPARIVFGRGTIEALEPEAVRLGCTRLMLVHTRSLAATADAMVRRTPTPIAARFPRARMHTPVEVTEEALKAVSAAKIDGIVALGGGSAIGLSKAIAVRTDLPQIVIPTTYAGSEMTPILGETSGGAKRTRSDPAILPKTVIYDVDLTMSLPLATSVTSGFNAIAHAIEALYARERNPLTAIIAEHAILGMTRALPQLARRPDDIAARADALRAAWLAGMCLGSVGMALHHKLCHTLGAFGLPHAETHTAVLPHALAYNQAAAGTGLDPLRAHFGPDPADALFDLAVGLGAPTALRDLGMRESEIDVAARMAMENPYWNPRPLDHTGLRALLARAWAGAPPTG